jgi:3-dehydroquinate dehydratase
MDEISLRGIATKVGCTIHKKKLTKYIVMFYLNTRMIFACRKHNEKIKHRKNNEKRLKKISKIVYTYKITYLFLNIDVQFYCII